MKRKIVLGLIASAAISLCGASAWALPGVLQNASRAGFWSNQFPDTTLMVDNYIYKWWDKNFDDSGDKQDAGNTYRFTADLIRLIRPWHFGANKEYQFILQGIIPYYNVSWNADTQQDASGVGDPLTYTALGWNNPDKTTHIQTAVVIRYPLGDTNAPLHTNAYAITPIVAVQQHFGSMFMAELSAAYQAELHSLNDSGTHGNSYFEANGIGTVMFGGGWDAFLQVDYTKYMKSRTNGEDNDNDGYNFLLAPGIGNWFRPNMQLSAKYDVDVKGKNTPKAQGINIRYVWIF